MNVPDEEYKLKEELGLGENFSIGGTQLQVPDGGLGHSFKST